MLRGFIGQSGLKESYQDEFPATTRCCICDREARHGFTVIEEFAEIAKEMVADLHPNEGEGGFWLHDCCAVAVYFCRECLQPTAIYNQA